MEEGFSRPVFPPKTGHFLRAVSGDPPGVWRDGLLQNSINTLPEIEQVSPEKLPSRKESN